MSHKRGLIVTMHGRGTYVVPEDQRPRGSRCGTFIHVLGAHDLDGLRAKLKIAAAEYDGADAVKFRVGVAWDLG